ncbi:hypothetical protein MKW92_023357, partial [Papaver armeniacum]
KDDIVLDLLVLPPGTDLHNHPLVKNGSIFLQGKASSMVAIAVGPQPGSGCLFSSMKQNCSLWCTYERKGEITACDLNKDEGND